VASPFPLRGVGGKSDLQSSKDCSVALWCDKERPRIIVCDCRFDDVNVRNGSRQSVRLRKWYPTYKGEEAHEADGTTVGLGSQPCSNIFSPECPTRDLLQGGKPATRLDWSSNSDTRSSVGTRSGTKYSRRRTAVAPVCIRYCSLIG